MERETPVDWDESDDGENTLSFDISRKENGNMEIKVYRRSSSSASNYAQEDDWLSVCKNTLFEDHVDFLKEIADKEYHGNTSVFVSEVLKPIVSLVDYLRIIAQDHYEPLEEDLDPPWQTRFENLLSMAIHPRPPDVSLHKGDFLLEMTKDGTIEMKYYEGGSILTKGLPPSDIIDMLQEDWTDKLRASQKLRFAFMNCVVKAQKKFERRPWRQIVGPGANDPRSPSSPTSISSDTDSFSAPEAKGTNELTKRPEHILDVDFEILYSEVAILPGSRDKRGGPVIFIDAGNGFWERSDMSSSSLHQLLMYLYVIPREPAQRLGSSIVVDARRGKNVKEVLEYIGEAIALFQESFKGAVHMSYVLVRRDSLLLLFSSSKIREKLNFDFQIISSIGTLHRDISQDQLPESLGGSLKYSHEHWIKFRTKLEPFMTGCRSAAKHAMNAMPELSRSDLGVTGEDCRRLLQQHQDRVKAVLEDSRLTALREEGMKIIERIHDDEQEFALTDDYKDTIDCVNRLFSQMNQVFEKLKVLSEKRTRTLTLCLKIRNFQEQSDDVLHWVQNEGEPYLDNHSEIADNISHAEKLQRQFDDFSKTAKSKCQEMERLRHDGQHLRDLNEDLVEDRDWVEERMSELEEALKSFSSRFEDRNKKLSQNSQFHALYKEAHDWSLKALRYVANVDLQMDDVQTREGIQQLKLEFENFVNRNPPLTESQLAKITQLAHHLGSKQLKMEAEQVITRCKEAEELFCKKQNTILSAERRFRTAEGSSVSDEASSGYYKDDDLSTESGDDNKDHMESMPIYSWQHERNEMYNDMTASFSESSRSPVSSNEPPLQSFPSILGGSYYSHFNEEIISAFNSKMSPKMKQRLKFIVEEMIVTEHDYVASLEYILTNYLPEMDQTYCPPTLAGKKNILFGNLERIYDFHKRYFSQELETFQHSPLEIGKCFLKWERQFYLYALYNKNKTKSDQLMDDYGNVFFESKQRELKDKLNLASYLIKPVQRLGKYALLLKDMINCCVTNDPRIRDLTAAQDMMKFQLRHGNDLLAMDCIRECDVNLKEQGCLLRQADFIVWYGRRKRVRRVFLFEHLILFTKSKKRSAQGDLFIYKHCMKNADVGLTENIGETGLKFELWYRRWRKSRSNETYVLQAPTIQVKEAWVSEIVKILWRQAQRNKDYGITEMTTGISVESQGSGIYSELCSSNLQSNSSMQGVMRTRTPVEVGVSSVKRLSWISGESSNSSGVFDLGGADDSFVFLPKEDDCRSLEIKLAINSTPGSPQLRSKINSLDTSPNTAEALLDRPLTAVRRRDADTDPSFIRTTIYRRTLHVDKASPVKSDRQLKASRRHTTSVEPMSNKDLTASAPELVVKQSSRLLNLPEASLEEEEEEEKVARSDKLGHRARASSADATSVPVPEKSEVDGVGRGARKKNSKDLGRKIPQLFKKKK